MGSSSSKSSPWSIAPWIAVVYALRSPGAQKEILASLNNQLFLRLGGFFFLTALIISFLVGVVIFFLMTDSLSKVTATVRRFKEGDYSARINEHDKGDLGTLSSTFNEMADVIVGNFDKITATDKFRQELIANISHDLRTPLSIIQGYVETLMIKTDEISARDRDKYLATYF